MEIEIENIAGIRRGTARLDPGINAVQGSNWQGKSSLIAAIETVMGTTTPLTEGEDHGQVALTVADDTVVTELVRRNGEITTHGESFLATERDRVCAELFAFLSETNPIRFAVRTGTDLEDLLTRPLEFENIDERMADHKRERKQVETELARAKDATAKLPRIQDRVTRLEADIHNLKEERTELVGADGIEPDIETKRDELSDVRAERDQVQDRVGRLEETIERTTDRIRDRQAELTALEVPTETDLKTQLAAARDDLHETDRDIELLRSVYEANKRVLDEERIELLTDVDHGLIDDTLTCWVCGSEADRSEFTAHLANLQDRITSLQRQAADNRERVNELETEQGTIQEKHRRKTDLEQEISDLESTLADREESLSTARDQLAALDEQAADLSAAVEDTDTRLTDIESEIKYKRRTLEDLRDELDTLESRAEQRELLEDEQAELTDRIEELRTRKDRTKRRTREAFDDAIDDILSKFDVGFEAARLTSTFELIVARDGREAPLETLSEGERELLGIVTALAGYTAFDISDRVPVMLLDGLGGIAKTHLHTLVDYLGNETEYLVVTAYPEHGSFDGRILDPSEWTIVADDRDLQASS